MYKHILAPTDGSDVAQKGLDAALALAKTMGAQVTVVTVTERLPAYPGPYGYESPASAAMIAHFGASQDQVANAVLAAAQQSADREGVSVETLLVPEAQPAEAIIETARSLNCDLIVMGSHGRRGLNRLLLGSKTAEVATQSPVPVLVVR